jgi:hypothetical protein
MSFSRIIDEYQVTLALWAAAVAYILMQLLSR